jgi:hypothetical protein
MKTFGELQIKLNGLTPEEFGDRAEAAATKEWTRDRSKDAEMRRSGGGTWFTFTLTGHASLPPTLLFVTDKAPGILYVPNVISPARDRLSYDEYNGILTSFRDNVLGPVQSQTSIDSSLTGGTIDLSTQLPGDVYRRLHTFSLAANKSTGSSHPFDKDRWMDFLIEAVEAHAVLDPQTLERWLVEEEQWVPEQASRLAEEYEFGRDLLERRRRAS